MVDVNDKVFVAPLYGQPDNIAVITGPAGQTGSTGTGGIVEGDYNTWTLKWMWAFPPLSYYNAYTLYLDEPNDIIYLWWESASPSRKNRFGVYNIADHSSIFESPTDTDYVPKSPSIGGVGERTFKLGFDSATDAIFRSHQTYIFLLRYDTVGGYDHHIIEVWKAGALLWTRDVADDNGETYCNITIATISLTGKYIMLNEAYSDTLMLYEGFDAGTSTTVTETVITDTAKSWVTNELIGHIVYITSGGADTQSATITSNTGITITCSAATFVTWGMSVGDTYKIS